MNKYQEVGKDAIGADIALVNGRNFAENDRIMFLQNDKNLDVKNGICGTVLEGNSQFLKIKIDGT